LQPGKYFPAFFCYFDSLVAALLLSLENNNNAMKEIKLLEEQIDKLKLKDFDLEAWKQYTIVLLARIFGDNNQKIQQIEKIEYDYSSWALRDTSGKSSYLDTCKKLGKEILMASIDELNAFGVPDKNVKSEYSVSKEVISLALENELKVSQFKELVALINEDWNWKVMVKLHLPIFFLIFFLTLI
jgi:hypothetical protein